ncbi:galectin-7-like [Physella acuta]|uniref:galectin-7-like n=1 Tax=Physella acuta TaxID=109671 RepID=UPI0027DC2F5D|nr:galectin-7-like [Physella acuta]
MCTDTNVKSQVPGTGGDETFFGIRQNLEFGGLTLTTNITKQFDIPCGLTIGNMIALRGVFTAYTGFILNVQVDPNNYLLHFRPQNGFITLNYKRNAGWGTASTANITSYPFQVGQQFLLNILTRGDGLAMFVDGKLVATYPYIFPATSVRYLLLQATVQLLQLSI